MDVDAGEPVQPRLRGWLHLGMFPVAVLAGLVLVARAPEPSARAACLIYTFSTALLFGVSALYHRGRWSPRVRHILGRLDHASIFLIIAGTYTPFTVLLLGGTRERILLALVWVGALVGIACAVLGVTVPRWLGTTPIYLTLGWTAVFFLPDFMHHAEIEVVLLLVTGGLLYSLGGIVYLTQRPNPSPHWFGFHEVFHALMVAGYLVHYIGVSLVV